LGLIEAARDEDFATLSRADRPKYLSICRDPRAGAPPLPVRHDGEEPAMTATAITRPHGGATDVALIDAAIVDRILDATDVDALLRAVSALGASPPVPEAISLDARVATLLRQAWAHAQRRTGATRDATDVADVHAAIRAAVHGPAPIPAAPDHLPVSRALAAVLAGAAHLAWYEGDTAIRLAHLVRALLPKSPPR
jgi:hypothetical protein